MNERVFLFTNIARVFKFCFGFLCSGFSIKFHFLIPWESVLGNNHFSFWKMFSIHKRALRCHQVLVIYLRDRTLPTTSSSGFKKWVGKTWAPMSWLTGIEMGWGPLLLQPEPLVFASGYLVHMWMKTGFTSSSQPSGTKYHFRVHHC